MEKLPVLKARYDLKEVLGQGGMGVVYRAYDTVLKCDVVVKTIRDTPEPAAVELFHRECEVLVALNHPNIVPILDIGGFSEEGHSKPYFVMPLLPGRSLDRLIRDPAIELNVQGCAEIIAQACRGLHAAHDRGLVHRDIKPANIFVMPDLSVELIDFGVAHMVSMGNTGQKGTLFYMAPELLQGQEPSPLSDIFALAVTAYELFTRRRPFQGATEHEVTESILHQIPPPASDFNPSIGQATSRVLHKAMAKQPWHRFSTAREFADCLAKATRGETIELFDPTRIRPRVERAKAAFGQGDLQFALEILTELEAEGHLEPDLMLLRRQIDAAARQRRIRQLLDSALTRLDGEEYPLALQKVQEVLSVDPGNAEAFALRSKVESTRSERQIEGWLTLARQHLENRAFAHAREALANVLKMRAQSGRAADLLAEVERREHEYMRIRGEKEQLYLGAVEAHQRGEISSAMTMLERVLKLDHTAPDSAEPERGAAYQSFYNQVRSEHDAIKNAYAEARKRLDEQKFGEARDICEEYLRKYPAHALFQALKFDIEEQQRLRSSGYVVEIDKRVEAEPNLEQKVEILQEALDRFPEEPHFQHALRLARERLELVNAIVSKARHHEQQDQFSEALGQWEILRTIDTRYPGLQFEIERVDKRREQHATMQARARWAADIDRHLQAGDYARARSLCRSALEEFPGDSEFAGLETLARQSEERSTEAQRLLARGVEQFDSGARAEGLEAIRQAHQIDSRSPSIRAALLDRLIRQARALMETDWPQARAFVQEVRELDDANAAAKSLLMLLEDKERDEFVKGALARARQFQAGGDLASAMRHVDEALLRYAADPRLLQIQATLRDAQQESERARNRRRGPEPPPAPGGWAPPLEPVSVQQAAQPEPAIGAAPAKIEAPLIPARLPRRRWLSLAAALGLILAASSAGWFVLHRRKPPGVPAATTVIGAPAAKTPAAQESAPPAAGPAGGLRVQVSPSTATLTYRTTEERTSHPFQTPEMKLPPGRYVVTATAPGYEQAVRTVDVGADGPQSLVFDLAAVKSRRREPQIRLMDLEDWDKPWTRAGDWFMRRGGGFALYSARPSAGTYQFTIRPKDTWGPFANPKVSWVADYADPRTYVLFDMDARTYSCTEYRDGRRIPRVVKRPHGVRAEPYAVRFYVEASRLVVMLLADDKEYKVLDDWSESGRDFGAGRFGFYSAGSDQVWLANFAFLAASASPAQ